MIYIIYLLSLFGNALSEVQKDVVCDPKTETDWEHKKIDSTDVCSGPKPCIIKCCFKDEVIHMTRKGKSCKSIEELKKQFNVTEVPLDYSTLDVYKSSVRYKALSSKRLLEDFTLLNSPMFRKIDDRQCLFSTTAKSFLLSEDGNLITYQPNHYRVMKLKKHVDFCVDMTVAIRRNNNTRGKVAVNYVLVLKNEDPDNVEDMITKVLYSASAMTVSSLFLALVMVVYALLHQLRNMKGMLLLGYVSTLFLTFALKAAHLFYRYYEFFYSGKPESADCTIMSQIIYFLMLSTFFWMNVMSFDLWWTFRGLRKRRDIHRRGINVKILTYALYAYGMPAGITIFAAVMDRQELPPHIVKPFFNSCLDDDSFFVYLYVPMMILMGMNCLLFLMTICNIWLIRRTVSTFNQADRNRQGDQNRFWVYLRLASLTGVGWVLELVVEESGAGDSLPLWLKVLLSLYNMLTGFVIFLMFVCKRSILVMLCRRFNIQNQWTQNDKMSSKCGSKVTKGMDSELED